MLSTKAQDPSTTGKTDYHHPVHTRDSGRNSFCSPGRIHDSCWGDPSSIRLHPGLRQGDSQTIDGYIDRLGTLPVARGIKSHTGTPGMHPLSVDSTIRHTSPTRSAGTPDSGRFGIRQCDYPRLDSSNHAPCRGSLPSDTSQSPEISRTTACRRNGVDHGCALGQYLWQRQPSLLGMYHPTRSISNGIEVRACDGGLNPTFLTDIFGKR